MLRLAPYNMKTKVWLVIFFSELVMIGIIGARIYSNISSTSILGVANYNSLKKGNLLFPKIDKLQYYYEPLPNIIDSDSPSWLAYKASYTINSEGLNERFEYDINKSPGIFRIVVLGDSFTFGLYVNTSDNYTEKLNDTLNESLHCQKIDKFEVLNLGESGYDILYSVERFALHGSKYNPDLVIWFVLDNDFEVVNELLKPLKKEREAKLGETKENNQERIWEMAYQEYSDKYRSNEGQNKIIDMELAGLYRFTELYKGPLVIMTQTAMPLKYKKLVAEYVRTRPSTYYFADLDQVSTFEPYDSHPNVKGHTRIAEYLFKHLMANKVIDCN